MGKPKSFRVGRVRAYCRGRIWYLCYFEDGRRRRPRVGPDAQAARQLAASTNAQLESGAPAPLSFEPIDLVDLRQRWLEHHEQVRRSSVNTIRRYRAASEHLLRFIRDAEPVKLASNFRAHHAESLVAYLRRIEVAPNGHPKARRRPLRDKGIRFILECCRGLFNYAAKRRHLPPYAENPFTTIEIDRIPIENAKPFVGLSVEQEKAFLAACDDWQFPIFLTLLLTGLRPGELVHLLLPDDLGLDQGWLHVRNKPGLGWQTKTRNERRIPLLPDHVVVLKHVVGERTSGPVFLRRRIADGACQPVLGGKADAELEQELTRRIETKTAELNRALTREEKDRLARKLWWDLGTLKTDRIWVDFVRLMKGMGLPQVTAPKTLRHLFATALQDANVDPLIRNELMGHAPAGVGSMGSALGMTGVYTHTRPETLRQQLQGAMQQRPALAAAVQWLVRRQVLR